MINSFSLHLTLSSQVAHVRRLQNPVIPSAHKIFIHLTSETAHKNATKCLTCL